MQDYQLSLDTIFRRAEQFYPDRIVHTGGPAPTTMTYGEWAARTRRLGGVLDTLGITADGRVGTFAWNSGRHLELYFAAPCSGRVLHTLNIRLFPDQVVYIANHAEDEVVFVDRSLLGLFLPLLDRLPLVRHVVVMDDLPAGAPGVEVPDDPRFHDYEELLAAASSRSSSTSRTRTRQPRCATRAVRRGIRRVSSIRTDRPGCTRSAS